MFSTTLSLSMDCDVIFSLHKVFIFQILLNRPAGNLEDLR